MIREFYQDRTLLLTGGTGFLGKGIAAKILRDLAQVRRIYTMVRPGKKPDGTPVSIEERLEEDLFDNSVFDRFKEADPARYTEVRKKIVPFAGDLTEAGLGANEHIFCQMCEEVDLIISSGATVDFDGPLDYSIKLNALGPQQLLDFARQCRREVIFLHISTSYVHGILPGSIAEEPLPLDRNIRQMMQAVAPQTPFDAEAEIADCQACCERLHQRASSTEQMESFRQEILEQGSSRKLSEKRLEKLIGDRRKRWLERQLVEEGMRRAKEYGWNDVYTFTKAMGEQMLVKHRGDLPLVIVRPSVIESSLADPEPGWISGLKVTDPLIVAYGRGMVPDFPARADVAMDLVPVDIVINIVLASALRAERGEVRVFHAATSGENMLKNSVMFRYIRQHFDENPMRGRDGEIPVLSDWTFPSRRKFRIMFNLRYLYPLELRQRLYKYLPERWVPAPKKRMLTSIKTRLNRILYFTDLFSPYTNLDCRFETAKTRALYESLPLEEQRLFNMDVQTIDWALYYPRIHLPGLRKHVLKEAGIDEPLLPGAPQEVGAEEERWRVEESIETIPDLLRWAGARYADKVALQTEAGGWRRCTYSELLQCAEGMAQRWQAQGLESGQRVLLYAENSPDWVVAYMAASCLGLAVVPLDPQMRQSEIWTLVEFVQARALVTSTACLGLLGEEKVRVHGESLFFFDLENGGRTFGSAPVEGDQMPTNWQAPRVEPDAVASIIFTSGMLVEPRGVMLRHRNFIADLLALAEVHQVYDSDQVLSMLPLHHGLEFTGGLLMPLLGGATITYLETLNSRDILKTMWATGTTAMLGVPRIFKILIDRIQRLDRRRGEAGETTSVRAALDALRLVVSGGAPLAPEIFAAYQELGISICEGYGLTEAGPIVAVNPPEHARSGSVGQALPRQEIDIDQPDEEGRGEILIRGANVMAGYFEQAELTDEVLRDGWLHTGDIGYLDGDAYLYITGRSKNLIVTGSGKNVYPEEVEELYRGLPQVAELSVVGVKSPRTLSEEVHAVAVVERDSGDVRDVEALKEEIVQRSYQISRFLPTYQRIQRLHIWERSLPRLDSGSVDRSALLAELQLAREELRDIAEIDESLPPWERQIYGQISQITGLSVAEVVAHVEAPLDTLLDSLMAVEFTARVEGQLGVDLADVDRGNHSLRMVLDRLEPHVEGKVDALAERRHDRSYWSNVLAEGNGEVEALEMGVGKRLLQGLVLPLGSAFFRAYLSLEVRGLEHLPLGRPYLIAANHCSHLDAPSLFWALQGSGERASLVAAQDYFFHSPLRSFFLRTAMNAIPFERYGDFKDSLRAVSSFLGVGRPLLIFPEGTRSLSGQLQPFKTGVGLLALELDVPIVPVHIQGTYEAFPKGSRKPSRGAVSLLFGQPMQMATYRERLEDLSRYEVYREVVEALRREIERLSGENRNG